MPPVQILQTFNSLNCTALSIYCEFGEPKGLLGRLEKLIPPLRKRRPSALQFGDILSGRGSKELMAVRAIVKKEKKGNISFLVTWFVAQSDPPEEFGRFNSLLQEASEAFGEREVMVGAQFRYPTGSSQSLFRPIELGAKGIFDEVVGFSGVKKDVKGKLIYRIDISVRDSQLSHVVTFLQRVNLSEDLPTILIQPAARISGLVLRKPEGATHEDS